MAKQALTGLVSVSNDGAANILPPFTARMTIEGTADLLFHRWSNEDVEAKAQAAKGSKAKRTDNVEAYVYRDPAGNICIPGRYLQRAVVEAARFHQDPRSPRKSARDLAQAAVMASPILSPVLVRGRAAKEWDYLDRQRAVIQRNAVTRVRPAFLSGWQAEFQVTSLLPEYVTPDLLRRLVEDAGRFVGLGDFRPTYGRFSVVRWEVD